MFLNRNDPICRENLKKTFVLLSFQRTKRQTDDVLTTLVQLGSKIFPLMASLMGTGNGNVATSGQAPTSATSLAAGSTPAALSAPAAATALAVVGQVPDATNDASGSKPTIQDKVSNAPSKVDKIGTAVEIALIFIL